jgi:nucleoside phosphorylase/tetratricopeptide (TPR) repeat protein
MLIPLKEEYEAIREVLRPMRSYQIDDETFFELVTPGGLTILAAVVGTMSQEAAAVVAERLARRGIGLLAVVGIAGSLSDEARLADVVAANVVDLYRSAAKAVSDGHGGFRLQLAGDPYRVPWEITALLENLQMRPELEPYWRRWRLRAAERREAMGLGSQQALRFGRIEPNLLVGHIASGTEVGATEAFGAWLKDNRDRSYRAIEMESGGVSVSSHRRVGGMPLIVLRGIADFSDERKLEMQNASEHWSEGAWRRLAVQNAADLLATLIDARLLPLSASTTNDALAKDGHLVQLSDRPHGASRLEDQRLGARDRLGLALPRPGLVPRDLLPQPRLIGRASDLADVLDVIRHQGISAIVGMGGLGKTALAAAAASQLADDCPDGVLYADLQGVAAVPRKPLDVVSELLSSIQLRLPRDPSARLALFHQTLADRRFLLFLDNARDDRQLRDLLPISRASLCLVTSRWALSSLAAATVNLRPLELEDAITMLGEVAGRTPTGQDLDAATRIAVKCGCLPILLRIIGTRLRKTHWTFTDLANRLSERGLVDELRSEEPDTRETFSLSYELLPAVSQSAFRILGSVRWRDFPLWAAAAALGSGVTEAADALDELVDASLLDVASTADSLQHARFSFHDLLREVALDLAGADEQKRALIRVSAAYVAQGVDALHKLEADRPRLDFASVVSVPDYVGELFTELTARNWYDNERGCLVTLAHETFNAGLFSETVALASLIPTYLVISGGWDDWEEPTRLGVEAATRLGNKRGAAYTLQALANIVKTRGGWQESRTIVEKSLLLFREERDEVGEAYLLIDQGISLRLQGFYAEALEVLEMSVQLWRRLKNPRWEAHAFHILGSVQTVVGDHEEAVASLEWAKDTFADLGDLRWTAYALLELGQTYVAADRAKEGERALREAIIRLNQLGEPKWASIGALRLADLHLANGELDSAKTWLAQALAVFKTLREPYYNAWGQRSKAELLVAEGRHHEAACLLERSLEAFEELGEPQSMARTLELLADSCDAKGLAEEALEHRARARILVDTALSGRRRAEAFDEGRYGL